MTCISFAFGPGPVAIFPFPGHRRPPRVVGVWGGKRANDSHVWFWKSVNIWSARLRAPAVDDFQ
eukprot:11154987-Lingulodinium_polyedra.AAC.1